MSKYCTEEEIKTTYTLKKVSKSKLKRSKDEDNAPSEGEPCKIRKILIEE